MSFFVKKSFSAKPPEFRLPNLGDPQLDGCICYLPLLEQVGTELYDAISGQFSPTTFVGNNIIWTRDQYNGGLKNDGDIFGRVDLEVSQKIIDLPTTGNWTAVVEYMPDLLEGRTLFSWNGIDDVLLLPNEPPPRIRWFWRNVFGSLSINSTDQIGERHIIAIGSRSTSDHFVNQDGVEIGQSSSSSSGAGPFSDVSLLGWIGSPQGFEGTVYQVRFYDRALSESELMSIWQNPWAPFEERTWIPVVSGIPDIPLNIDSLAHGNFIDSVSIESSYILAIDAVNHASALDECAVTISEAIGLLIDTMAHASVLDEPLITPTYTLLPQALAHAHPLDECAAYWRVDLLANGLAHVSRIDNVDVQAAPEIVIDIDAMTHGHALDAIALEYETTFSVDGLRHGHPVDAPDVSALLGLLTTVQRTDTIWRINAGQSVDNASGVDAGWHVVEAIFDGAVSILSIDGAPVAGNAGVRELNSLTLGAELDGGERLTGDVGELRIYNGALTQTQRDKIRAELQAKWL